jgi:23S rRNA (guanine745-N1)-methyltransferase
MRTTDPTTVDAGLVFACPVCGEPLSEGARPIRCDNGHSYDRAREGYVNLLLANQRRSREPGYSKEMMDGRRRFFDSGYYEPLADGVARLVTSYLPAGRSVVLDAGCGEGYYLRRLAQVLGADASNEVARYGLDLSKPGIRQAARRDPDGHYAVAGTFRMPVLDAVVDVLLTHFSPVSPADFHRVVAPEGIVLVGGPGEGHLYDFKKLIYDEPSRHEPSDTLHPAEGFEPVAEHRITYPLKVRGQGHVADLLLMTPYFWSAPAELRERLSYLDALDTEVDVVVQIYRRISIEPDSPVSSTE